jgi:hypothetical protein
MLNMDETQTPDSIGTKMRSTTDSAVRSKQRPKADNHFKKFLSAYKLERPTVVGTSLDDCVSTDIDKESMDKYAAYLEDKLGAWTTAKNYFSATKNALTIRFPGLEPLFRSHNTAWQAHIKQYRKKTASAAPHTDDNR